jgi:hypothetical protein
MGAAPFRDEVVPCPYIGSGEATERLLSVAALKYRTVSASAERLQFARVYRPLWSLILGIALLPILIGIPFLLVKSTETWSAAIEEDHRKVQVRITGRVLPVTLVQLADALAAGPSQVDTTPTPGPTAALGVIDLVDTPHSLIGSHEAMDPGVGSPQRPVPVIIDPSLVLHAEEPVPSVAPPQPPVVETTNANTVQRTSSFAPQAPGAIPESVDTAAAGATDEFQNPGEHTVLRSSLAPRVTPVDAGTPTRPVTGPLLASFDTGERHILESELLVGRDPEPTFGFEDAVLLAIDDQAKSVSKTHLALRRGNGRIEVVDLGSTNGTRVIEADGRLVRLTPREPRTIGPGTRVEFGDRSFVVDMDHEGARL